MKTLKNRKWFALIKRQRAPNIRLVVKEPITFAEIVESDEVLRIVHVVESYAMDRDSFCLLKKDFKKISHISPTKMVGYVGRVSPDSLRHIADIMKITTAGRWVHEPRFQRLF